MISEARPAAAPAGPSQRAALAEWPHLRVATYNIRHGLGMDQRLDIERVAETIAATGAEVVALQEVDQCVARSGGVDQPRVLERLTGLTVHFFPTLSLQGGRFGIALAARERVEIDVALLASLGKDRPHGRIAGRYLGITFVATHLSRWRSTRNSELASLATLLRSCRRPAVLMGDLNARPYRLRRRLQREGLAFPRTMPPTYSSVRPRRRVDYIAATDDLLLEKLRSHPSIASDHLPLVADLTWRAQATRR